MKITTIRSIVLLSILFITSQIFATKGPGVYGGGPFYKERGTVINELRQSGFEWVVVWTIHMEANGDLGFNGEFDLVKNGQYIGATKYPHFANDIAQLKTAPTTINWVEFGLAGWGSGTFGHIRDYVKNEGTAPGSTLYENFKALKEAIPSIDAISFDDEDYYDEPSTTAFAIMLADLGFKVSVCPYTRISHWQNVVSNVNAARPGTIEDVHIQCYAGGAGNSPCTWNNYFAPEINVMPGVEDGGSIGSKMASWNNQCGITGGWLWLYDDFFGNLNTVQSYASAISNNITAVATTAPEQASAPTPANGATDISTSGALSWTPGSGTTSHKVYLGTTNTPTLVATVNGSSFSPAALDVNTTYYWRVDEVNSIGTTVGEVWSFTTSASTTIDHTDPVGTGTVTARGQIGANEAASMAFDNKYVSGTQNTNWSKWLDNSGVPSSANPSWIQIQLPEAVVVNNLAIVCANDDYGRDPENFNLQASTDGSNWVQLGSWSGQTWASRFLRKDYAITNTTAYSYFRLNVTKNDNDVAMTQLCEVMLIGDANSGPVTPTVVDHTDPVGIGAISARSEYKAEEAASLAFDNLYSAGTQNTHWSKWLDGDGVPTTTNPSWIQIQLPAAVVVDKLAIVSANDDFGRDPENFNLQASNDGNTWTELGSWSAQSWASRLQQKDFALSNSTAYSHYRLNITKNDNNVAMTQLCEIMLFGNENARKSAVLSTVKEVKNALRVYPNPAQDYISIDGLNQQAMVEIYNVHGKKVSQKTYNNSLNVSDLPSGVYFLVVDKKKSLKFLKK